MSPTSSEDIKVGDYVGKWELTKKIAKSGFNDIYLGRFENIEAAIKIPRDEEFWDKIDNEILCLNYLENRFSCFPHILDSYTPNDSVPWLALEVIEGKNLKEHITNNGPLEVKEWFVLAEELMKALSTLESKSITHEDIKPTNIFYTNGELKIIDFGLARIPNWVNNKLYEDSSIIDSWAGTFEYSSPEHFSGEHVSGMDVFSAASTLVFAGSGRSPFYASNSSEWMKAIGRDGPSFHNLTEAQIRFLNPLFAKNKSERQSSKECLKFLNELNESGILENNPLFKTWPYFENLTGNNFENDQIYQKLFKNRLQANLSRAAQDSWILLGNILLVTLFFLIYINPLNKFIRELPPQSISEKRQSERLGQIMSCLYDSYQLDVGDRFNASPTKDQQVKLKIEDVKSKCEDVASSPEALGYLGLANLTTDFREQEQYLIQAARIAPTYYFEVLLGFYSDVGFLHFELYGKPSLEGCTIEKDLFCLRVMGNMHYKVGRFNLDFENKEDYKNLQLQTSNEDTVKGINYLRQAAELGDVNSAIDLATISRSETKPIEYLDLIKQASDKKNTAAMNWMYGQALFTGDKKEQYLLREKLVSKNDPTMVTLDIMRAFYIQDYDKANKLAQGCLTKRDPTCYSLYASILNQMVNIPEEEVERNYLLAAIMGDTDGINSYAKIKVNQGKLNEAEWWYRTGRSHGDVDSYIGLGDVYIKQNEISAACINFKLAAVKLNRRVFEYSDDNYLRSSLQNSIPEFNNLHKLSEDVDTEKLKDTTDKIEVNCIIP